jgi:GNAT superfamily N-acetyltransferase
VSSLEIVEVRSGEEELLTAWHRVYDAAERQDRPYAVPWELAEVRADLAAQWRKRRFLVFAGLLDGEVVCTGTLGLPMLDNTGTATADLGTAPTHRRQGHATTMLDHLVAVARAHDRSVLFTEVGHSLESGPEGRGEPGPEFAAARGFTFALGDIQRELDPVAAAPVLDEVAAEIRPWREHYRIGSFAGPVPADLLASYVALDARVSTDAPMGELDLEPEVADLGSWREMEQVLAAQRRTMYSAVALDAAGQVVAYTLAVVSAEAARCFQWGTLVAPEHRGHRLGLAVKVANLRLLSGHRPEIRSVVTYNAEATAAMVAVNDRLGFRPVARLAEFQRRI